MIQGKSSREDSQIEEKSSARNSRLESCNRIRETLKERQRGRDWCGGTGGHLEGARDRRSSAGVTRLGGGENKGKEEKECVCVKNTSLSQQDTSDSQSHCSHTK